MMKSAGLFLIGIFFTITIGLSQAQLSISNYIFPDTVDLGSSFGQPDNFMYFFIQNIGSDTLKLAELSLYYQSGKMSLSQVVDTVLVANQLISELRPGQSISISADLVIAHSIGSFDPAQFDLGINDIIIWPRANDAITADSVSNTVFVKDAIGVNELDLLSDNLKVYPNPANKLVNIDYGFSFIQFPVTNISLLNQLGDVVHSSTYPVKTIDIRGLQSGIYSLQIALENGGKINRKLLVKQE